MSLESIDNQDVHDPWITEILLTDGDTCHTYNF